jgi:hypothetical protein
LALSFDSVQSVTICGVFIFETGSKKPESGRNAGKDYYFRLLASCSFFLLSLGDFFDLRLHAYPAELFDKSRSFEMKKRSRSLLVAAGNLKTLEY